MSPVYKLRSSHPEIALRHITRALSTLKMGRTRGQIWTTWTGFVRVSHYVYQTPTMVIALEDDKEEP